VSPALMQRAPVGAQCAVRGAVSHRLAQDIEFICDAHTTPDAIGPLISAREGSWAYCAGHASDGHSWRRIPPLDRADVARLNARVALICASKRHLDRGLSVPDGHGILTVSDRKWAYCSAALREPHEWRDVEPIGFSEIEHDQLTTLIASS